MGTKYNRFAVAVDQLAKSRFSDYLSEKVVFDVARDNHESFPEKTGASADYAAKAAEYKAKYLRAEADFKRVKAALLDSVREVDSIRSELEKAVAEAYKAKPGEVDAGVATLLAAGIMTEREYSDLVDGYLYRSEAFRDGEREVLENGNRFLVDWTEGQKTGFFLDQRENRALVAKYAAGRQVLNLFCYTGGFSIYALAAGAAHVDSVDSSAKAMSMVDKNVALNGFTPEQHTPYCADAIEFLRKVPEGKYDLMIVDPPAFAKHRGALNNALRAYQRLNAAAISRVAPGGLVFTFSCSQVVDKEAFALAVFSAAAQTRRSVRILDRLNQPADHAVNIYHPEGEYLKGLLLYVE